MSLTSPVFVLALTLSILKVVSARADDLIIIEDWTAGVLGARAIPAGWTGQTWGHPRYDFTIVIDNGQKVLHLHSENESSTISKAIAGQVLLPDAPLLEWQWKAMRLPTGGDTRKRKTTDQAAQLYVAWPRFPLALRSRIIGYVWDTTAPVGLRIKSQKTHMVTYIVVRSGTAELGQWITERRNIWEDYTMIFGETPPDPGYLLLSIDSNDTQSCAEAFIGPILFRKK